MLIPYQNAIDSRAFQKYNSVIFQEEGVPLFLLFLNHDQDNFRILQWLLLESLNDILQ